MDNLCCNSVIPCIDYNDLLRTQCIGVCIVYGVAGAPPQDLCLGWQWYFFCYTEREICCKTEGTLQAKRSGWGLTQGDKLCHAPPLGPCTRHDTMYQFRSDTHLVLHEANTQWWVSGRDEEKLKLLMGGWSWIGETGRTFTLYLLGHNTAFAEQDIDMCYLPAVSELKGQVHGVWIPRFSKQWEALTPKGVGEL